MAGIGEPNDKVQLVPVWMGMGNGIGIFARERSQEFRVGRIIVRE